jgi:uncharacterized membrane protein YfcA
MDIFHAIDPVYALSGLLGGLLVGMTGVGGGSLMTPLLILLFGIHPEVAVGTDLLYASATKTVGTAVHGIGGSVDWRVVGRLAIGSLPGTALTILGLSLLGPSSPMMDALISMLLGASLSATVLALIFRDTIFEIASKRLPEMPPERTWQLTVFTGFAVGVLVTISSVGAGALGTTALIFLYPRMPMVRIVGSDLAHAVPLTLIAGAGHYLLGGIDWSLFESLLVGSIPGIIIGSAIAAKVPELVLRLVLAGLLAVVAGRLLLV